MESRACLDYKADLVSRKPNQSKPTGSLRGQSWFWRLYKYRNEFYLNSELSPGGGGGHWREPKLCYSEVENCLVPRDRRSGYLADELSGLLHLFQVETPLRQPPNSPHPCQVSFVLQLQEKCHQALIRHTQTDTTKFMGKSKMPSQKVTPHLSSAALP